MTCPHCKTELAPFTLDLVQCPSDWTVHEPTGSTALSPRDTQAFLKLLETEREPSEATLQAVERYKQCVHSDFDELQKIISHAPDTPTPIEQADGYSGY